MLTRRELISGASVLAVASGLPREASAQQRNAAASGKKPLVVPTSYPLRAIHVMALQPLIFRIKARHPLVWDLLRDRKVEEDENLRVVVHEPLQAGSAVLVPPLPLRADLHDDYVEFVFSGGYEARIDEAKGTLELTLKPWPASSSSDVVGASSKPAKPQERRRDGYRMRGAEVRD